MTTSLRDALRLGGVTRNKVPHKDDEPYTGQRPPRNKEEWMIFHNMTAKVPSPSRPRPKAPERSADGSRYIVLPYSKLRDGSIFVPIERMGKTFYYNKKVTTQVDTGEVDQNGTIFKEVEVVKHLSERKWAITRDLFIKDSNARSMSLTTGRDAVFALNDWCIVKA